MKRRQEITVHVPPTPFNYPLLVQSGSLAGAGQRFASTLPAETRRVLIVSNRKVFGLYGAALLASFRYLRLDATHWLMGDGERFKSVRSWEQATAALASAGLERSDAVVALGGGVVGDLAGFAGATYLRGIALVQVPTTLLSQIDSSVGGKVGINTVHGKNSVGAFHPPSVVLIDPETLNTLPPRELTAGWCEAIKQAAVADRPLFDRILALLSRTCPSRGGELDGIIARLCAVKAAIVGGDPRESWHRTDARSRRILNFGHTVGHALETATGYRRFRHGEAVGIGMLVESEIAKKLGILPTAELELLRAAIALAGPMPQTRDLDPADITDLMKYDKKRVGGSLKWVLLERLGLARIVDGNEIPRRLVTSALRSVLAR